MPIDCLVRVSFQSRNAANRAINQALTGDPQAAVGTGPFQRVNTAMYRVVGGRDADVHMALNQFVAGLGTYWSSVDFVGISMTKRSAVFNIEFDASLREQLEESLTDISRLELAVATAADERRRDSGSQFEVQAGPFRLLCQQRGHGRKRSYFVRALH